MLDKNTVFCFTGKCIWPRNVMEDMAIKAGASVTKSVTSRTTILVLADIHSQSSKTQKARMDGVELITPQDFNIMCMGGPKPTQKIIKKDKPIDKPKRRRIILD